MAARSFTNKIPFLIITCFCTTNTIFSLATDTISATQTLSGNQTIVSSGGNFELGFFTPGKSSKYYIGIWYKKVSEKTVIWVANRETPVFDTRHAQLKISGHNLVVLNESQIEIWSTALNSTTLKTSSASAVLLDDGRLILQESNSTIWDSFDYPSNTWMPGQKLYYDKRTHKKVVVTSWRNSEDPSPGLFSLEFLPNDSKYIIKWNNSEQYWSSGTWNGHIFSLVPEMRLSYNYNFSYVDNENESYFVYTLYNSSIISRTMMDTSGQIKQHTWTNSAWMMFWSQPRQQCEVYAFCGAFGTCNQNSMPFCNCLPGFRPKSDNDWNLNDYSDGCVRDIDLQCRNNSVFASNGSTDKFLLASNMNLPLHPQKLAVGSKGQCESACLDSCSCSAYAYDANGCLIWNDELLNLQQLGQGDGSGRDIRIRYSAASSVFHSSHKKGDGAVIVGAVSGAVVAVLIVLAIVWTVICNNRRIKTRLSRVAEGSLIGFSYKDLQLATKNFSIKLGGGAFGSVFKGTLADSTKVAVKKLESISQGEKQFRTEVSTIGTIQHMNLVRLRGFCSERNKKLLVYDYMENGSLDSHLFGGDESKVLNWEIRYRIALGVARGLAYLHDKCRECIIHCDVKPENILLDADFCPKVGDFGLAKLMGRDFSRVLTTMRGTRGYLAPEWISGVPITAKADVYSYGMMLFELVSGSRNSEYVEDGRDTFFPCLAARVIIGEDDVLDLLDPILERDADGEEVLKVLKVACWCIQDDENLRPSMGQIVQIFEGVAEVRLPPIPRSLQLMLAAKEEHVVFFTDRSAAGDYDGKTSDKCSVLLES
ncbi:G-type lectin S-receptor-like serine/threonine-protein kinase At2g19130 [Andrographis paniculata]|uniref:G-type lectin S-receptor-like serine/threonine-protein kinase At2g19130 n=1 Tax=Andrographis paniculata TaxID=175694 RepID=UPI0021E7376A|nr:G-type lectin S-receptor-like serine/threonine-protein kinase At2g19130 [Andrographis paniculata]